MRTPADRPVEPPASITRWWFKPAVIAVLNIAAVLILITFVVGWSTPALVVVLAGFALGTWWFLDQRPSQR